MEWTNSFADRTRHMRRSTVRELLKLAGKPDMISFAGGLPAAELFPLDDVKSATLAVLSARGSSCLQYGETEGIQELRNWVAEKFSTPTQRLTIGNVAIVSGGQQGLDLLGRIFLNESDSVLVESPTYLALLSAWRPLGVEFIPVPSDGDGMRSDLLPALASRLPKLIYTIPNFQNPQGTTLSLPRRQQLLRFAREKAVPIVEDNPYGDLQYDGDPLPHLLHLESAGPIATANRENVTPDSRVIYVGTFSKVLMPGLRLGWVIGPPEVIGKLIQAKQAADLHTSTFSQHVAWELIRTGVLDRRLPVLRAAYRDRRDAMLAALQKHCPSGIHWTRPLGGMFLLVTLPKDFDANRVLQAAILEKVAFVPGEDFHVDGSGRNTLRLSFSNTSPELIERGIARLGHVLMKLDRGLQI